MLFLVLILASMNVLVIVKFIGSLNACSREMKVDWVICLVFLYDFSPFCSYNSCKFVSHFVV